MLEKASAGRSETKQISQVSKNLNSDSDSFLLILHNSLKNKHSIFILFYISIYLIKMKQEGKIK